MTPAPVREAGMSQAYYNEFDPFAAAWLRELIAEGHIAPGVVDERSIVDVQPEELREFTQVHLFAGIGGWSLALRLAGWPDDRPVWTGSCPCQPFSAAGKREGVNDERHLWPEMLRLIEGCRPAAAIGEQVASAEVVGTELEAAFVVAVQDGDYAKANKLAKRLAQSRSLHYWPRWIDGVRADLEAVGYSLWFKVLGAHSVYAPHPRQRLWWVADAGSSSAGRHARPRGYRSPVGRVEVEREGEAAVESTGGGASGGLEHSPRDGREQRRSWADGRGTAGGCGPSGMVDAPHAAGERFGQHGAAVLPDEAAGGIGASGAWADSAVIDCRDGKRRRIPVEPALFPLAPRLSGRVGLLRGAGNSIVPQVAAAFVTAYMDVKAGAA